MRVVTSEKLAARIAVAIEDDVVAGGWAIGSSLGSEADLIARYGASRGVLREAVRIVEHHEAARMRRGPSGGLIVRAPDSGPAVRALVVNLVHARASEPDLLAARLALEPLAGELAAQRASAEGQAMLATALAHESALSTSERILDDGPTIHGAVAAASGNAVLELFVQVLMTLSKRQAQLLGLTHPDPAVFAATAHAHERIAAAYAAAVGTDGSVASCSLRAAMASHLRALHDPAGAHPSTPAVTEPFTVPSGAKVAETVATAMLDEIVAAGWPVGQVVGSETDLLTRYGVSRAAMREAVRILEHHGAARMRRGPGGGLQVTAPEPTASIAATALYLNFRRVPEADVQVARIAVESACLEAVLTRAETDPSVAEALRATQHAEPGADAYVRAGRFHRRLAELSGNPILLLFTHVLTAAWVHHAPGTGRPLDPMREAALLAEHLAITDAIAADDRSLAVDLLAGHIETSARFWH